MKTIAYLTVAGLAVLACGGVTATSDAGSDGASPSDAATSSCPTSPPPNGTTCSTDGLDCEYGTDPNVKCNTIAECGASGWTVITPEGADCPTVANPSACPATFAAVPIGQSCSNVFPTLCSYPQGFCGCTDPGFGVPLDAQGEATWVCDAPASGCPMPRPKIGTPCSEEGLSCNYSSCILPSGTGVACTNGAWSLSPEGCPG